MCFLSQRLFFPLSDTFARQESLSQCVCPPCQRTAGDVCFLSDSVCVFQLRPPTVIGQFHTLFFGSVRMFFLGVLGFAVYGNEALHFSCDPDRRELNLYCYNQFRPITPQVRQNWAAMFSSLGQREAELKWDLLFQEL